MFLREYILRVVCQQLREWFTRNRSTVTSVNKLYWRAYSSLKQQERWVAWRSGLATTNRGSEHNNFNNQWCLGAYLATVGDCDSPDPSSSLGSHTMFDGAVVRVSRWLSAKQFRRVKIPYRPPPSTKYIKKGIDWC